MGAKRSQIDKAIAALEAKKAVLDAAIQELKEQQQAKPARRRKLAPVAPREEAAR